ncbi:MAG: flagellar hook-length control protein FliK [Gammaproteobacteria bacterium]|nr:flagellar hook-length control protein FliK [Gammaproteobacteria bacterium]
MFQLALLAPGMQALGRGESAVDAGATGLAALLRGDVEAEGLFPDELHALLMQFTPEMMTRLDELVRSGMNLPQAANQLLGDAGTGEAFDSFSALLSRTSEQRPSLAGLPQVLVPAGVASQASTAAVVAANTHDPSFPANFGLPPLGAVSLGTAGVATGQPTLASQLTGNLLDMAVAQQVGSKGWSDAIGERVMWMMQGDQQFARLKLNPPQLGPLEIRVNVSQDQSSVAFIAQHAATREALEAALPRLREMFDQASLQLVRADVGDPASGRDGFAETSGGSAGYGHADGSGENGEAAGLSAPSGLVNATALVDLFA